jgi:hypothetical protein
MSRSRQEGLTFGSADEGGRTSLGSAEIVGDALTLLAWLPVRSSNESGLWKDGISTVHVLSSQATQEHDIFGDGVNVAARLEALAEPGGICISRTVRDHIGDRLPYAFEDMRRKHAQNLKFRNDALRQRHSLPVLGPPDDCFGTEGTI